uniref:Uncharacterized protein n=1 Tax=Rhizophora mucronata TaxID=61149 RepID=A0A2P2QWQ5_RHIMU
MFTNQDISKHPPVPNKNIQISTLLQDCTPMHVIISRIVHLLQPQKLKPGINKILRNI